VSFVLSMFFWKSTNTSAAIAKRMMPAIIYVPFLSISLIVPSLKEKAKHDTHQLVEEEYEYRVAHVLIPEDTVDKECKEQLHVRKRMRCDCSFRDAVTELIPA